MNSPLKGIETPVSIENRQDQSLVRDAATVHEKESHLVQIARSLRYTAYKSLTPADYLFRSMVQLKQYPPLHLRRHVGGMSAGLNGPGYEFYAYLRLLSKLREGDNIWDIACGCGMLELALNAQGWRGCLVGTDIHKPCIDWAQKNLASSFAGHKFVHMDIRKESYNPKGKLSPQEWVDSFAEKDFDVVVAKSLFTHVLPQELSIYLKATAERLKATGKALLTFFILSEEQALLAAQDKNSMLFHPFLEDGRCAVYRPSALTAAVAYDYHYLEDKLWNAGFKVTRDSFYFGSWTGRADGLSYQDIVLLEKA